MSLAFSDSLPNLPGFRSKDLGVKKLHHSALQKRLGQMFVEDVVLPDMVEGSCANFGLATSLSRRKLSPLKDANVILTFQSYFEEIPTFGKEMDMRRVRKCCIYFYVENGTIMVVERPQMNSGIPQGTLVNRAVVVRPDGQLYSPQDFILGGNILIYGRKYHLVDCDAATRKFLQRETTRSQVTHDFPRDFFEETSGLADDHEKWGKHHSKRNANKTFMEAMLGNTVNNTGRDGFMRFGNITLRFRCVWDNTSTLYGDWLEFTMVYYLSDDTVEIFSIPAPGKEKTRLLKRSRLPKHLSMRPMGSADSDHEFYEWGDLYIGLELIVYKRTLRIVNCDEKTREFYMENDVDVGCAVAPPEPAVLLHEREIPPPTAFGSEEDSMRSCEGHLMPGPVPSKKLGEDRKLCFFASLFTGGIDDVKRRFVITYHVQDGTLKIQEPPVRNSGFNGGEFLSRRAVKTESGDPLNHMHLWIGARVSILKHGFLLLDANETTLRWMEDRHLPRASYYSILDKIRPVVVADARSGKFARALELLEEGSGPDSGVASKSALTAVLAQYDLLGDGNKDISEHEIISIVRGNGNKDATFSYIKFIEQIIAPTDEYA